MGLRTKSFYLSLAVCALCACDSNSNHNSPANSQLSQQSAGATDSSVDETALDDASNSENSPELNSPIGNPSLILADQTTLQSHFKQSRLTSSTAINDRPAGQSISADLSVDMGMAESALINITSRSHSTTNIHIDGVDEGDISKYDGNHWFIASQKGIDPLLVSTPSIKIVKTDPQNAQAELISNYDLGEWGYANNLYLVQNNTQDTTHLVTLQDQWNGSDLRITDVVTLEPNIELDATDVVVVRSPDELQFFSENNTLKISVINVEDTSAPTQTWAAEIDGDLIDSRKVGNTLYLVTKYYPYISQDDEVILPQVSVGEDQSPIATECFVQESDEIPVDASALVSILAIDIENPSLKSTACWAGDARAISMSDNSLYLTAETYNSKSANTLIHKFAIDEGSINYAASGSVEGSLGWRSDPAFRLDEHNGDLRVVSTLNINNSPSHKLHILEQRENKLVAVATLPNKQQPSPIGKLNEDIYAVRFLNDRAYIVTFLRTDPLYTIDLSQRLSPKIKGELEVPGFATYIHPIGEKHLLTLGHQTDTEGWFDSIKVELIDVSNDNPTVLKTLTLGEIGGISEATENLHAISMLQTSDDQLRISFPLSVAKETYASRFLPDFEHGLQLLEINGLRQGNIQLSDAGFMNASANGNERINLFRNSSSRSILHDDAVFFTRHNQIWTAFWQQPEQVTGPISQQAQNCEATIEPGLSATVSVPEDSHVDACSVSVIARDGDYVEALVPNLDSASDNSCLFTGILSRPGTYEILSTHPELAPKRNFTTVYHNACHVLNSTIEIETQHPIACDGPAQPSFEIVLVPDTPHHNETATAEICGASVTASLYDFSQLNGAAMLSALPNDINTTEFILEPKIIDNGGEQYCAFSGPIEKRGTFKFNVEIEGFHSVEAVFDQMEGDACGVDTFVIDIFLAPSI